jgi:hypothetical protein
LLVNDADFGSAAFEQHTRTIRLHVEHSGPRCGLQIHHAAFGEA